MEQLIPIFMVISKLLLSAPVLTSLCYAIYQGTRIYISWMICKHPDLSDTKVQAITQMISADKLANIKEH